MTVAHIAFKYGSCNTGGAAIAATRLHNALLAHGVESHYICIHQCESGKNVHELPTGWRRCLFIMSTKISRCVWKFSPYRKSICVNVVPLFGLERELARIRPDVVHVQWINNDVCSFEQLAHLPYRIVFNLHDLYLLNAIEFLPCGDRRFIEGFMPTNSTVLERYMFERKRRLLSRPDFRLIGPSEWVCKQARDSIIGRDKMTFAISNIIASEYFNEGERRKNERFTILFGSGGGRQQSLKGFEDLVAVIKMLPTKVRENCELHILGENDKDGNIEGMATHFLGKVTSSKRMVAIYRSADVFAFPSRQETQGMMKIEALLCGTPVVAFNRSACAEGIVVGENGFVADDGDIQGFVEGIMMYYSLFKRGTLPQITMQIAKKARAHYSDDVLITRICEVYRAG